MPIERRRIARSAALEHDPEKWEPVFGKIMLQEALAAGLQRVCLPPPEISAVFSASGPTDTTGKDFTS